MPLLAEIPEAAFSELADVTVLGKDSFIKDEKTGTYRLAMDGAEAGKLALPLQAEIKKLGDNNAKLLDEKIKTAARVTAFEKLGKTPEEIDEILKSGKTPAAEEIEKKYAAQLEGLKTEHQRALDAMKEESEGYKTEAVTTAEALANTITERTIAELRSEFGIEKHAEDWFRNRIKVEKDPTTGKYVEQVIENGEIAYKGMALKTPKQLAEEARADKELSGMFRAGTAGGSGADGNQRPFNAGGAIQVSREASKTNPQLYQTAKAQAEKSGAQVVFVD